MKINQRSIEPSQHGSVLTEYIVVLLGFAVVWTTIDTVIDFIREHHDEFSSALQLPF
jgi:hypothetical protein